MDNTKRRLPSWMLGAAAAEGSSSLEPRIASEDKDGEEPPVKPRRSRKPKLQVKQSYGKEDIQEREPTKETLFSLKKCEGKRGKRKGTSDHGCKYRDESERTTYPMDEEDCQNPNSSDGCNDNDSEEDADEAFGPRSKVQGKKFSEVALPLLKKYKSKGSRRQCNSLQDDNQEKENDAMEKGKFQSDALGKLRTLKHMKGKSMHETEESFPSDGDLTVEDLVSIAKEYVKADDDKQHGGLSCMVSDSSLPARDSSRGDFGRATNDPETEKVSLVNTSVVSHPKQSESFQTKERTINYVMTGDPAQDMLNLFLGPLLGKSEKVETKSDAICKRTISTYESRQLSQHSYAGAPVLPMKETATTERTMFDGDSSGQSQQRVVGAAGPLMKKKVSLKDKVARLLD